MLANKGNAGQFPVRSIDGGRHWTAAGPLLASDWAGGSLYYVTKVISEGPSAVVMVSNAIIDVTTDGGRRWFQYLNAAGDWSISRYAHSKDRISIRVSPPPNWTSSLPKNSYAIYVLNLARQRWNRVSQSLS